MTRVIVNSGICGFSVNIIAEKGEGKDIRLSVDTECGMVKKMAEDISTLGMMAVFKGFLNNPVYKAAERHLKHAACPVPSGILKALEAEAGLCLPKDVKMSFIKDKEP